MPGGSVILYADNGYISRIILKQEYKSIARYYITYYNILTWQLYIKNLVHAVIRFIFLDTHTGYKKMLTTVKVKKEMVKKCVYRNNLK